MRRLKAWLGAALALVVLGTATLHVLSHPDLTEATCVVCHMQEASLPGAPAPAVVTSEAPPVAVVPVAVPAAVPATARAGTARAPPAVLS